jgi:acyl-CoA reductase-like NAD-dependent aldehyde dehydrogenase
MVEATQQSVTEGAQELVDGLRKAGLNWAKLPPVERARRLKEAGRQLLAQADELAEIVHEETHKPLAECYASEVLGVADLFAYWCKHGPEHLKARKGLVPALDMPGKKARVERRPRGVVALITPWNYPVAIPMRTIVPALLAGNTVALKPSEWTPRCALWLVERLRSSLGPVVGILEGEGDAGAALVAAGPDMVVFTGSTRTGRKVAVACARRGIPCESELGGKDCAVVLEDADISRAAAGIAWGILTNAGQNCAGIERVAVHAKVAEAFTAALVSKLERAAGDVPRLVTPQQRKIVVKHIRGAIKAGGRALTGGVPADAGAPLAPTLLVDVPRDNGAWTQESFGPVAVLTVAGDEKGLIAAANDSRFGLGASVWSRDLSRAEAVADQLETGMVWINNHSFTGALPDLPWVGTGESGTGVTNSPEALMHLTRPRLVVVDSSKGSEPWWYPYSGRMLDLMKAATERQRRGGISSTLKTLKALKARKDEL